MFLGAMERLSTLASYAAVQTVMAVAQNSQLVECGPVVPHKLGRELHKGEACFSGISDEYWLV